eukprot:COSAG02_NODE_1333_length_13206_cov_221.257801_13_plen_112_part_00
MQSPRGLHRNEIVKLVKRVEKRLLLLPPRFDIESDWALMLELAGLQTGLGRLDSGGLTRSLSGGVHKAKRGTPAAENDPEKYSANDLHATCCISTVALKTRVSVTVGCSCY